MGLEHVLVTFGAIRSVSANGVQVGVTNRIMLIAPGEYIFTLDGNDYAPASQTLSVAGTTLATPAVVAFQAA